MWDKSLPGHTQSLQHYAVKNPDYFRTSMPLAGYCNTCQFLGWLCSLITVIKLCFISLLSLIHIIFFSICYNSVFVCVKIRLVCEPFSTTRDLEKKLFYPDRRSSHICNSFSRQYLRTKIKDPCLFITMQ